MAGAGQPVTRPEPAPLDVLDHGAGDLLEERNTPRRLERHPERPAGHPLVAYEPAVGPVPRGWDEPAPGRDEPARHSPRATSTNDPGRRDAFSSRRQRVRRRPPSSSSA